METEKKAIPKGNGAYAIGNKLYVPAGKSAVYLAILAIGGGGGILLSDREIKHLRQENTQLMQDAKQNGLELACDNLAASGVEVKAAEGDMCYVVCDEYGAPALQEREE